MASCLQAMLACSGTLSYPDYRRQRCVFHPRLLSHRRWSNCRNGMEWILATMQSKESRVLIRDRCCFGAKLPINLTAVNSHVIWWQTWNRRRTLALNGHLSSFLASQPISRIHLSNFSEIIGTISLVFFLDSVWFFVWLPGQIKEKRKCFRVLNMLF